jgi:hypothetical protein
MGLLDRIRPTLTGGETRSIHVVERRGSFAGNEGDRIYSSGFSPADAAGNTIAETEHRTSDPQVFHCKVAGTHHWPSALADSRFQEGARVVLRAESGSAFDRNAVGIWDAGGTVQVGYLPTTLSRIVSRSLREGNVLGGQVIRELRIGSPKGRRIALYVLVGPPGRVKYTVH